MPFNRGNHVYEVIHFRMHNIIEVSAYESDVRELAEEEEIR